MKVIDFIIDYWPLLSPVILEIILRLTPTGKDLSIISNIVKILDKIIPNIRKPKGNEGIADFDKKGNVLNNVKVRTDRFVKTILLLFVFSISLNVANAQTWQNFKGVRLVNQLQDTTDLLPVEGSIFYNFSEHTFYGRTEFGWKPFNTSTGGGGITNTAANNELAKSNGTNLIPSGFFSTTSGNLILGSSAGSGFTRDITVDGSAANIGLSITPKGAGGFTFLGTGGGSIVFNSSIGNGFRYVESGNIFQLLNNNAVYSGQPGSGSSPSGNVTLKSADVPAASNQNSGNVTITAGNPDGTGVRGKIILLNLPTSAAGLPSGALWNNAGVLNIAP